MPTNALKQQDYVQDNAAFAEETWEVKRAGIARAAEEACHLAGNNSGPDLEEFVLRYSISFSNFA